MVDITGSLNEKGDINAAAIGIYVVLLLALIGVLIKGGLRAGYLYILAFALVKIVGAGMTIDVQLTLKESLVTPAAIISTVVLSPLMLGTCSLITPGSSVARNMRSSFSRFATKLVRLIHIVILLALGLGVYGGLDAFGTNPTSDDITNGKKYLRISAALYVVAWAFMYLAVAMFWSERHYIGNFYRKLYPVIAFLVMPIFAARLVYTCGTAATIDEPSETQIFNPLQGGSWVVYLFLAFLPEVAISVLLVLVGLFSGRDVEGTKQEHMRETGY